MSVNPAGLRMGWCNGANRPPDGSGMREDAGTRRCGGGVAPPPRSQAAVCRQPARATMRRASRPDYHASDAVGWIGWLLLAACMGAAAPSWALDEVGEPRRRRRRRRQRRSSRVRSGRWRARCRRHAVYGEYAERLRSAGRSRRWARSCSASVNLLDGATTFHATDIDIPATARCRCACNGLRGQARTAVRGHGVRRPRQLGHRRAMSRVFPGGDQWVISRPRAPRRRDARQLRAFGRRAVRTARRVGRQLGASAGPRGQESCSSAPAPAWSRIHGADIGWAVPLGDA